MNIKSFKLLCLVILVLNTSFLKAQISITTDSGSVGVYNVYELTINHPHTYPNNWEDVVVNAVFNGPETIHINGFYYDNNIWKIRFAPPQVGNWNYVLTFITRTATYTDTGSFKCVPSVTKGFLKRHPINPFRLVYADGSLFNGVGFEDCALDFNNDGTPLDDWGFDGGFYPQNSLGSRTDLKTYMTAYGSKGAGFNLFRWTTNNCSFGLYNTITTTGNTYLTKEGMYGDTIVRSLRSNNIRIWLTFFGPPVFGDIDGSTPLEEAAIKRYVNYIVARYGAYVDIWELFNESSASDYYYTTITAYLRSIDPYHRLISVSDERPQLQCIDINSPHWYQKESELQSDAVANQMITSRKSFNKPIIFGEQGNSVQNWDVLSALRMRLRAWTAFFSEGMLIFWNTSFAKNYYQPVAANIYLGPLEREYIRALQDFTANTDSSVIQMSMFIQNPADVRGYGLISSKVMLGYFHHYSSHADYINTSFTTRLRWPGTIYWINPVNDSLLSSYRLPFGTQTITSPQFNIDMAMRIDLDSTNSAFDDNKKLDLVVYPNPATEEIAVSANFNGTAIIILYNMAGKKVFTKSQVSNNDPVSIKGLSNGVYIYKIMVDGNRTGIGKLIIKNR